MTPSDCFEKVYSLAFEVNAGVCVCVCVNQLSQPVFSPQWPIEKI